MVGQAGIGIAALLVKVSSSKIALPTAAEWEAFLDDLQQTLDKFAVPQAEQAEIKAIVASTRADIVV